MLKRVGYFQNSVPEEYKAYYNSRTIEPQYLCHAPFNNMYFDSVGNIANCWLTFVDPERYDGTRSIKEIWFGEKFSKLRQAIQKFDLDYKCKTCKHYLEVGNHVNVLAKAYDNDFPLSEYPSMMEFELTNTCNLECTMCTGLLSSAIRANREKLPALKSPYDDKFVEDLREFIPHLHEARFNGGEPFLIHIYYKIWDLIHKINPNLKIVVATNGTVLTPRVKKYLERGNFHLNISIDSLDEKIYSQIRVNGNLNKLLENFVYFKEYCLERNRKLCIMVNPMRSNWQGMGQFVDFCNEQHVHLWFNSIVRPYDQAIWNLSADTLKEIYETLSNYKPLERSQTAPGLYKYNTDIFNNLVQTQIKTWYLEAKEREMPNDTIVVEGSPQERFKQYLELFLKKQFKENKNEADAARESIFHKMEDVEEYIHGKMDTDAFYEVMNGNDMEAAFLFLLENSSDKIQENIDRYVFHQP